jgi:hypothetical protein
LAFFNGGYKDKDGQSHYYPAMDVTMTMSDEGRDTYNKAALKETALTLLPWGRVFRLLGLNRVGSYLFGKFTSYASTYLTERAIISEARLIMQNENGTGRRFSEAFLRPIII